MLTPVPMTSTARPRDGIAALRRFVRAQPVERCELCGTPIATDHDHLLEMAGQQLRCACRVCASAMDARLDQKFRVVPRRVEALPELAIGDAEWAALNLPIDMAFLLHSTPAGRPVARYPGPTGIAESWPSPDAWTALLARNPPLGEFEPDVETLLVNRINGKRLYFRAPIDRCYRLAGLLRTHWQGWSGGDALWQAIEDFFAALAAETAAGRGR